MLGNVPSAKVEYSPSEAMFETRPDPLLFSLWLPRSFLILSLPVALCGLFFAYLKIPGFFRDPAHWLLALVIIVCVIVAITVLIGLPGSYLLATRKRIWVTPNGIEVLVLPLNGPIRDRRNYYFYEIESIEVGQGWFNCANICIRRRSNSGLSPKTNAFRIVYYQASFFRLMLNDDLKQNIIYGVRNYRKFLDAIQGQAGISTEL